MFLIYYTYPLPTLINQRNILRIMNGWIFIFIYLFLPILGNIE